MGFKFYMHSSAAGFTPYHDDGYRMSAVYPETTIVRGKVIAEQGEIIGQAGYGQMVAPLNS